MKQHITHEQTLELSKRARKKLYDWYNKYVNKDIPGSITYRDDGGIMGKYLNPYLSIGQMIEFLDEHTQYNGSSYYGDEDLEEQIEGVDFYICWSKDLCDALFEAVKEILEKETK